MPLPMLPWLLLWLSWYPARRNLDSCGNLCAALRGVHLIDSVTFVGTYTNTKQSGLCAPSCSRCSEAYQLYLEHGLCCIMLAILLVDHEADRKANPDESQDAMRMSHES